MSLVLIQDILRPGDLDLRQNPDAVMPDASILSTTQLLLRNLYASGLVVQTFLLKEEPTSHAHQDLATHSKYRSGNGAPITPVVKRKELLLQAGKMRLAVKHVSSNPLNSLQVDLPVPGLASASPGTVLEAFVNGLEAFAELPDEYQRFSVRLADSGVNAVNSAAELVTGTVHSWFIVSRAIEKAVYQAHYRPVSSYRRLLTDILQFAHREDIVTDPLFLNRPTAAAVHLRSNTDWKILAHLRHVLRRLSAASQFQLQKSFSAEVSAQEDFRTLVSRLQEWHNWELDELVIRRLPLVQSLFRPAELPQSVTQRTSLLIPDASDVRPQVTDLQLLVAVRSFTVAYFEDGECTNKLVLGSSEVLAMQNTAEDAAAVVRVTIGPLLVALDPGLLRLILHISRVRRVFGRKLEPLISRPYAETEANAGSRTSCSLPLRASLMAESIDLSTHASEVRASLTLQNSSVFAALNVHKDGNRINATDSQVSLTADTFKLLTVTEGSAKPGSSDRGSGTLISIQLEGLSTHVGFDMHADSPKRYLRLLAMVRSTRVRVPRSLLKLSQL